MTYLHSETTARLERLVTDTDQNSTYQTIDENIKGHFKKIDQVDGSFDVSNIEGTGYKMSVKRQVDVKPSDRFIIDNGPYAGTYSVADFKFTKGITFDTTKIFVIK